VTESPRIYQIVANRGKIIVTLNRNIALYIHSCYCNMVSASIDLQHCCFHQYTIMPRNESKLRDPLKEPPPDTNDPEGLQTLKNQVAGKGRTPEGHWWVCCVCIKLNTRSTVDDPRKRQICQNVEETECSTKWKDYLFHDRGMIVEGLNHKMVSEVMSRVPGNHERCMFCWPFDYADWENGVDGLPKKEWRVGLDSKEKKSW
jgi:hypothetical protein